MNETYSLVAFSFLFFVISAFWSLKAFFEIFKRAIKFITRGEVDGDNLVNTDQFTRDFTLNLWKAWVLSLLKSCFKVIHSFENVENLLLANTETLVSFGLTFSMLGFNWYVKASLVEVRSSFPIVKLFELLSHTKVLSEAILNISFSLIVLSLLEIIGKGKKWILGLLKLCLASTLIQTLLLLQLDAWLNLTGGSVRCDIEKVNIWLKIALLYKNHYILMDIHRSLIPSDSAVTFSSSLKSSFSPKFWPDAPLMLAVFYIYFLPVDFF